MGLAKSGLEFFRHGYFRKVLLIDEVRCVC